MSLKNSALVYGHLVFGKLNGYLNRGEKNNKTYFFLNDACVYLHARKGARVLRQVMVLMAFKVSLMVYTGVRHSAVSQESL